MCRPRDGVFGVAFLPPIQGCAHSYLPPTAAPVGCISFAATRLESEQDRLACSFQTAPSSVL
jgi:hypothetical protein